MREIMYSQSSLLIVAALLLCMVLSIEFGYRIRGARRKQAAANEAIQQASAVLVSMLGLLALLLAFTFSASLQRYDDRSRSVVAEANAIGTAYLRAELVPGDIAGASAQDLVRQYLDVRIREGRVDFNDAAERNLLLATARTLEARLWGHAVAGARLDPGPVTSGLFIQSLNDLIDASAARRAANSRHVPEVVIFLVFATILVTTATLGYASGLAGHRVTLAAFVLVVLIALVVYLIIDLDRPRRGSIQVSQDSLVNLQQVIGQAQLPANPAGATN